MILIIAQTDDSTARSIVHKLRQRGVEVCWFDRTQFPMQMQLGFKLGGAKGSKPSYTLRQDGKTIDLDRITAVWYRAQYQSIPLKANVSAPVLEFIERQANTLLDDFWHSLDCLWVPGSRAVVRQAESKTWQLELAQELGWEIPPTLITNHPEEVLDFYREHHGQILSKTLHNGTVWGQDERGETYLEALSLATKVTPRDIGYVSTVSYSPTIFQAYIPKHLELRVTVVGRELFACEIHSQQTYRTRHDWRRYDLKHTPHYPHQLPPSIRNLCFALLDRLGICYGAIDLILTPDGRYIFLEINPNGQFGWIEDLTGLSISDALCDLLTHAPHLPKTPKCSESRSHFLPIQPLNS